LGRPNGQGRPSGLNALPDHVVVLSSGSGLVFSWKRDRRDGKEQENKRDDRI